jgi:hypothetical protein
MICTNCRAGNPAGSATCWRCGTSLASGQETPQPTPNSSAPPTRQTPTAGAEVTTPVDASSVTTTAGSAFWRNQRRTRWGPILAAAALMIVLVVGVAFAGGFFKLPAAALVSVAPPSPTSSMAEVTVKPRPPKTPKASRVSPSTPAPAVTPAATSVGCSASVPQGLKTVGANPEVPEITVLPGQEWCVWSATFSDTSGKGDVNWDLNNSILETLAIPDDFNGAATRTTNYSPPLRVMSGDMFALDSRSSGCICGMSVTISYEDITGP